MVEVVAYCDNILLVAPGRDAAQIMIKICEDFAASNNIFFSTDPDPNKSRAKCIFVVGPQGATLLEHCCSYVDTPYHGWRRQSTWVISYTKMAP